MKIECPNCNETFDAAYKAHVPDEQIVFFVIKYTGERLAAKTVHGVMAEFEKLLLLTAKEVGAKACVFLHSIEQAEKELKIGYLITTIKEESK